MITVKKIDIKEHADELDAMDDCTADFDFGQHGHYYAMYLIRDLTYWDAIVVIDAVNREVVAVKNQVIGLDEAQKILEEQLWG